MTHTEIIAISRKAVEDHREYIQIRYVRADYKGFPVMLPEKLRLLAVSLRLLESQPRGRILHPPGVQPDHLPSPALQQADYLGNVITVFFFGYASGTWRLAFSRMEIKAWPQRLLRRIFRRELAAAVPQRIKVFKQLYQAARIAGGTIRPEIYPCRLHEFPGKQHPREIFICNADPRISLGIFQEYVVLGLVLLDKVVFQKQRVRLAVHDGMLQIRYPGNHQCGLARKPFTRDKVLGDPVSQRLGLAHIYHLPRFVKKPVNTRGVRQQSYSLPYIHFCSSMTCKSGTRPITRILQG